MWSGHHHQRPLLHGKSCKTKKAAKNVYPFPHSAMTDATHLLFSHVQENPTHILVRKTSCFIHARSDHNSPSPPTLMHCISSFHIRKTPSFLHKYSSLLFMNQKFLFSSRSADISAKRIWYHNLCILIHLFTCTLPKMR